MSSQQQQPVQVYPNTITRQPSSHFNGSFGTVFIVLAVIVVISAVACFLGRLCNRRVHHPKPKQNHASRTRERDTEFAKRPSHPQDRDLEFGFDSRPKERDIEFGFDKRIPTAKPMGNGHAKAYRPSENGETRPAGDGEFRGGA